LSISITRQDWTKPAEQANVTVAVPTVWRRDLDDGKELPMRGDAKVIEYLNRGLRLELTAVNQYWLHYRIFDNWGFLELAKKWREESIEEMRHADHFAKRILFLEGFPNMQVLDPLRIGQTVEEIIACDLATEIDARALYIEAAVYCDQVNDRVSMELFESIIKSEEEHIDFLETQQELIKQLGVQLYAQKHMGGLS
jgi:bacterioferritin